MRKFLAIFVLLAGTLPALALTPDELLPDPILEARARDLSARLRCLVCQNQSIDDSDAPLARDLRTLIREQLVKGESDAQIIDFVVARYGEFVLLRPRLTGRTVALWATPFIVLVGAGLALVLRRREASAAGEQPLTEQERRELRKALESPQD